jgi:hypothetical protein
VTEHTTHLELDIPDDVAIDLCRLADKYATTPHELAGKALRWYVVAAARRGLK